MIQNLLMGVLAEVNGDHSEFANKLQSEELVSMLSRLRKQVRPNPVNNSVLRLCSRPLDGLPCAAADTPIRSTASPWFKRLRLFPAASSSSTHTRAGFGYLEPHAPRHLQVLDDPTHLQVVQDQVSPPSFHLRCPPLATRPVLPEMCSCALHPVGCVYCSPQRCAVLYTSVGTERALCGVQWLDAVSAQQAETRKAPGGDDGKRPLDLQVMPVL